jgi:BTB/POZ domain
MGSEVVSLYIGEVPHQQMFTIHKNLLFGAGAVFEEMFSPKVLKAGQKMVLKNEDPIAFKLFVEFLYSRQVPGMRAGMTDVAKAERLRNLCQVRLLVFDSFLCYAGNILIFFLFLFSLFTLCQNHISTSF